MDTGRKEPEMTGIKRQKLKTARRRNEQASHVCNQPGPFQLRCLHGPPQLSQGRQETVFIYKCAK